MWNRQVELGCVPYYMFLARTVRGPSMSATPGKVQVLGVAQAGKEKVITMRFLQGRNPDWVHRPFFATYDEEATWLDDLKPAFGDEKFFFEEEMDAAFRVNMRSSTWESYE
jgi:hypothetical protein